MFALWGVLPSKTLYSYMNVQLSLELLHNQFGKFFSGFNEKNITFKDGMKTNIVYEEFGKGNKYERMRKSEHFAG